MTKETPIAKLPPRDQWHRVVRLSRFPELTFVPRPRPKETSKVARKQWKRRVAATVRIEGYAYPLLEEKGALNDKLRERYVKRLREKSKAKKIIVEKVK
jgi:hypothetical protein